VKAPAGYTHCMKPKLERLAHALILAPMTPLIGFLSGWWGGFTFAPEAWIPPLALAGLLAGLLADVFLLKRLLDSRLSWPFWSAVFLFYSIGMFGFFMGVPLGNALLAIPAGFVVGARLASEHASRRRLRQTAARAAWCSVGVLALICAASAFFALSSSSTPADLRGLLGLGFEVTQAMLVGLIVVGGAGLLAAGWGLTQASVRLTYRLLQRPG
jgi:hypothetical protein